MPIPVKTVPVVKKRTKKFKRHQSDRFKRVRESWRRPKGIDSAVRRKFRGTVRMPNIGYGSNKRTRHMLPNGFHKFPVKNIDDLELLLMHNRTFCAEIAHNVSTRKRELIVQRAKELDVKIINGKGRLRTQETE